MRPVERGPAPRVFTQYKQAAKPLKATLGNYCSYCERYLPTSLAVEHVQPKSSFPELEREWSNFLLGCTNCNSVKLSKPTDRDNFLWPDTDNTTLAFGYSKGGFIALSGGLPAALAGHAERLMRIVGLQRHPHSNDGHPHADDRPAPDDARWEQRDDIWALAERYHRLRQTIRSIEFRDAIVDLAIQSGFFSVWMTVFADDTEIRHRLIGAFKGTAADCFDVVTTELVQRQGGKL